MAKEYAPKNNSKIVALRKLDKKAKLPSTICTYTLGIISALIFGASMCLGMQVIRNRGHKLHMILMIAMAAYAFTKITIASINFVKACHSDSKTLIHCEIFFWLILFVSIFALQRSMLATFEGMTEGEILIMNLLLGSAVCVIVFLLGMMLIKEQINS